MSPRVFAVVVAWNDRDFLPELLASLGTASTSDVQTLVIDNGSDDASADVIRAQFPQVVVLRNARNLGRAQALNQACRYAFAAWEGEALEDCALFLVSPDTVLMPGCLEALRAELAGQPGAGAACGTLLRAFRDPSAEHPFAEAVRSDVIESTGIAARKNRTFFARGSGGIDRGELAPAEPFGASSSFGLFRASALYDVRAPALRPLAGDRVLDPDVASACADADLAWRLRLAGWTACFVPAAKAYRFCGARGATGISARLPAASRLSPRDRWTLIFKNELVGNFLLASPRLFLSWLRDAWRPACACAPFAAAAGMAAWWPKRRAAQAVRRLSGAQARKMFGP